MAKKLVDKSKFTFDALMKYTEDVFRKYLDSSEAGLKEEREKEQKRKQVLRESMESCHAGTVKERQYVKGFIQRILTGKINVFIDGYGESNLSITEDNFMLVFPWDKPYRLPTQVKFLGIMYFLEEQYGTGTFDYIVRKYNLAKIRQINTIQGDDKVDKGAYIDAQDIDAVFDAEGVVFTYELAMNVLVQLIYEEYKGNGCIDELIYQDIDDIGIGLSGLQSDIEPVHLKGRMVKKAYNGAWIKHRGMLIHLTFLSFHNFPNLKRVVKQLVSYDQQGSFSEKDGFKLGYGKDGSRRTSVIDPFAENPAAWIRKFTAKDMTNRQLIMGPDGENSDIKNAEWLIEVEKALVKGGATIPICGPQGAGKTTKLEAITEYIQNWYAIRMIESEFEARIRWRYPEKNILTVQTPVISPEHAYEFSLRTSGDIYIVAEARSDEMMVNITRTANRGGRSVIFTYHPNKPRSTVIEVANSLIRQKLYTSLKDAMYTTLEVIKCCIHIEIDLEKRRRYYNIYEFVPAYVKLDDSYESKNGRERDEAFQKAQFSFYQKVTEDEFFKVVPIITYDRHKHSYEFSNTISDRFYDELVRASSLSEEKDNLEKLFRPNEYIARYIERNPKVSGYTIEDIKDFMNYEGINEAFVDFNKLIEFSKGEVV